MRRELTIEVLGGMLRAEISAEADGSFSAMVNGDLFSNTQRIEPGEPPPAIKHSSYGPVRLLAMDEKEIESVIKRKIEADFGSIIRIEPSE